MRAGWGVLVLLALTGCVEETDASLAAREAAHATAPAAAPDTVPTRLVASLTEWSVALSQTQITAGTVSVDVQNNGSEPHAFEIEGGGQELHTDPLQPGEALTMTLVLRPGTYQVYCPLASGGEAHADRGMKMTLEVR